MLVSMDRCPHPGRQSGLKIGGVLGPGLKIRGDLGPTHATDNNISRVTPRPLTTTPF